MTKTASETTKLTSVTNRYLSLCSISVYRLRCPFDAHTNSSERIRADADLRCHLQVASIISIHVNSLVKRGPFAKQ